MSNKLGVLDLFSGIGGFSLGLERTGGFKTVAFCEMDEHCQNVLRAQFPDVPILNDVTSVRYGDNILSEEEYFNTTNIDVITGGFPCQDISFAGGRNGIKAERSGLWSQYCRLIKEVRPKYAIIENVEYLRKNGLGVVLNDLARIGYDAEWACIPAKSVGYPHQRKRLFIISYPSSQRQYEHTRQERHLQTDKEWESAKIYSDGEQCESKSIQVRPVLSRGIFDGLRSAYPDEGTTVSSVRRVTDGLPLGLDEKRRKQRIKQLGNSIVPRIAEILGKAILAHNKWGA